MKTLAFIFVVLGFSTSALAFEFKDACAKSDDTLIIGGVGDLLIHKYIHMAAQKQRSHYSYLWQNIGEHVRGMDIMYANLETPLARGVARDLTQRKDPGVYWDEKEYIYSGYPAFNTHPVLAQNLKAGGFDVVSTANNHAADRGLIGIDATIDALEEAGLPYTGTRRKGSRDSYITIVNKKGWKVAFIACTYGVNGGAKTASQVLHCYSQRDLLFSEIAVAKRHADAVVVTPHWGNEDSFQPTRDQINLGAQIAEAGADVIIGTHAHRIQPMEKYNTRDGREVPIYYGTGNFVSSQPGVNKIGLMAVVGLSKRGNKVWVNGARYLPLYMTASYLSVDFLDRLKGRNDSWKTVNQVMRNSEALMGSSERLTARPQCH
ncbi:MAG: CapA family protein [Bdellovibrionaceae bacterium]|nr:CapA family protein [Pseudobdellovibrionaceae bacterium]